MSTNLQRAGACRVLGPDHPLARVTSQLSTAGEQCLAVSLALAVGVYALIDDLSIGAPLTLAAATVLAGLLARVGALVQARNRRAVDLIAEGRGSLPVEAVMCARRRLLDPAERECLARTFDVIRAEVARPAGACHALHVVYTVPVVRAVSATTSPASSSRQTSKRRRLRSNPACNMRVGLLERAPR